MLSRNYWFFICHDGNWYFIWVRKYKSRKLRNKMRYFDHCVDLQTNHVKKSSFLVSFCSVFSQKPNLEPSWTSMMELFAKIANCFHPLTIFTKRSILDVWQCSENAFAFCQQKYTDCDTIFFILWILRGALHKKWIFPLKISSVNVTKYEVSCGFGYIYWSMLNWLSVSEL